MKRFLADALTLTFFAVMSLPVPAPADDAGTKEHILFDGKSLEGWITGSGGPVNKGWQVEDATIHRASRGGHIYYEREFGDFDFSFEWKLAKRGNSGVKYRVRKYGNRWLGCEYQLLDDGNRRSKGSAGSLYALYEPNEHKQLKPNGEWNQARIVVRENKIEHWLNGKQIVSADLNSDEWRERLARSKFSEYQGFAKNKSGRIMLQDHGHPVWFRNLVLRTFEASQ